MLHNKSVSKSISYKWAVRSIPGFVYSKWTCYVEAAVYEAYGMGP